MIRIGVLAWLASVLFAPTRGFAQLSSDSAGVSDLPLVELPCGSDQGRTLALVISGDGGWMGLSKGVARGLADHGIAVVGLDARSYLGTPRTPEQVATDVSRVLHHYLAAWHRDRVIIVGHSRGADIAPFVVNRLPADLRSRIDLVAMLGLGQHAGFHVGFFDVLHTTTKSSDPPVAPEIVALRSQHVPMVCEYGVRERESYCREAPEGMMLRVAKTGGHHFDGDYAAVARDILALLDRES